MNNINFSYPRLIDTEIKDEVKRRMGGKKSPYFRKQMSVSIVSYDFLTNLEGTRSPDSLQTRKIVLKRHPAGVFFEGVGAFFRGCARSGRTRYNPDNYMLSQEIELPFIPNRAVTSQAFDAISKAHKACRKLVFYVAINRDLKTKYDLADGRYIHRLEIVNCISLNRANKAGEIALVVTGMVLTLGGAIGGFTRGGASRV